MAPQQPNSNPSQQKPSNEAGKQAQQQNKDQKNDSKKSSRFEKVKKNKALFSVLFLIVLIVIAAIGVGIYSLLNRPEDSSNPNSTGEQVAENNNNTPDTTGTEGTTDQVDGTTTEGENTENNTNTENNNSETNTNTENNNGSLNGEGASTTAGDALRTGHSQAGFDKSQQNSRNILATGIWQATDYTKGDVTNSPYTIQLGDTLWEIAEGYYGDGFQWVRIKDANPGKVTTLPDGSWALIFPDAILTLP